MTEESRWGWGPGQTQGEPRGEVLGLKGPPWVGAKPVTSCHGNKGLGGWVSIKLAAE